jgi:hypothetical protein
LQQIGQISQTGLPALSGIAPNAALQSLLLSLAGSVPQQAASLSNRPFDVPASGWNAPPLFSAQAQHAPCNVPSMHATQ